MRQRRDRTIALGAQRGRHIGRARRHLRFVAGGQSREQRTGVAVTGAGGVDRVNRVGRNKPRTRGARHHRAGRTELERDRQCALVVRPAHDVFGRVQARERGNLVDAREEQVAVRERGTCHCQRAWSGPERRPEVEVVTYPCAGSAGACDGFEHGVARRCADGLRDARAMQPACALDQAGGNRRGSHAARGAARSAVGKAVAVARVSDEVEAGIKACQAAHTLGVDPFSLPQRQQVVAEHVVADLRQIGAARAHPGRGDGAVGGVAAEACLVVARSGGLLVELDHRFADGEHIDRLVRHARASRCCMTRSTSSSFV